MEIVALALLGCLSLVLTLWQWLGGRRYPLHERAGKLEEVAGITLLKPLKGADAETEACLASWLAQDYPGPVQVLFGVASADDPVVEIVERLLADHGDSDAELVVCGEVHGVNRKVSTLIQLQQRARHEVLVVSDADVRVPPDLLRNMATSLCREGVGLVNCLYRLANPKTPAMEWEAVAINSDFWSQVLQARSLGPLDFGLGAVMAFWRETLEAVGGWEALADHLADDYELGHRISRLGKEIVLCTVVASCWESPRGWGAVWRHQLRWARTIRVCRPTAYFFSLLSNATFWPLVWLVVVMIRMVRGVEMAPGMEWLPAASLILAPSCLVFRVVAAWDLQRRMAPDRSVPVATWWMVPVKDLMQVALWVGAFTGNRVEWCGERYRVGRGGEMMRVTIDPPARSGSQ